MKNNNSYIYLDHAAATPIDDGVLAAMLPYLKDVFYNPSSPYLPAVEVRNAYETAKEKIAFILGVKSDELVMTAGATESINLAINSLSGHIITDAIEHESVIEAVKNHGNYTILPVSKTGMVQTEQLKKTIRPDTELITLSLGNSEIGVIQPLSEVANLVKQVRQDRLKRHNQTPLFLHSDASQAAGLVDLHVNRLGVDMLTLNSAKIYGPKQIGLLWANNQVVLRPIIVGGGQENGLRSGTENVAGVIGFSKALEIADKIRYQEVKRLKQLRDLLKKRLISEFPWAIVSGETKKQLPNFLHISFDGVDAERLIFLLEEKRVLVATGSACAANKNTRSHVLTAIGMKPSLADGSLRLTLGRLNNEDNVKLAAQLIIDAIKSELKRTGR